jgi:hypothetical protein
MERKFIPPKKTLGASSVGSVLGLNPWCTREQLKTKLTKGHYFEKNVYCDFGNKHEKTAICFYEHYKKVKVNKPEFMKDPKCWKFSGIADGLVNHNGGIEIKCHMNKYNDDGTIKKLAQPLRQVPANYLSQMVTYMYLYNRSWWDLVSCTFNEETGQLRSVKIHRIYMKNHIKTWNEEWYPKIRKFINEL